MGRDETLVALAFVVPSRALFQVTAAPLLITEAADAVLGIAAGWRQVGRTA